MAAPSGTISGVAVAIAVAGAVVLYSGIKNATVPDTLRALLRSEPVPSSTAGSIGEIRQVVNATISQGPITGGPPASGEMGARMIAEARRHLGKPWRFGAAGPSAMDCSGLVNLVCSTLGLPIPGSPTGKFTHHGPVSQQYYVWTGAQTVPRPPAAGDLLCWMGHIGIAVDATTMVDSSSGPGKVTERKIWWNPAPLVRRIKTAPVAVTV